VAQADRVKPIHLVVVDEEPDPTDTDPECSMWPVYTQPRPTFDHSFDHSGVDAAGHEETDAFAVGFGAVDHGDDLALVEDGHPIGEAEHFVEFC
jgi:hypothetical protein